MKSKAHFHGRTPIKFKNYKKKKERELMLLVFIASLFIGIVIGHTATKANQRPHFPQGPNTSSISMKK